MRFCSSLVLFVVLLGSLNGHTQGRGGGPPPAARAAAPFDMTGYWVSIVSEDWRWRMFPNKGFAIAVFFVCSAIFLDRLPRRLLESEILLARWLAVRTFPDPIDGSITRMQRSLQRPGLLPIGAGFP